MSTIQADVGRQTKVVIIGGAVLLAAAAYLAYTYSAASNPQQSTIGPVPVGAGAPAAESEHYGEVLVKYNKQNAVAAERAGQTYLSVFSLRPQTVAPPPEQQAPADQQAQPQSQRPDNPGTQQSRALAPAPLAPPEDARQQERVGEQARGLMNNWAAVAQSPARVSEVDYARTGLRTTDYQSSGPQPTQPPLAPQQMIVPAFALAPAILGTDIDTDETSMVEATIPSGTYAGASVFAMGYKRLNNSVDMTFSFMKWNGRTYRINAKSIDKDTLRSALSGEVNSRYFSRILLPAIAMGLARAGRLFEQDDAQTIVTPFGGVVQTRSGTPSAKTITGTVAGGVATEAGQVLRSDAAQQPIKQVLIPRNETIGVRFIDPVFASDEIGARASAPHAPAPAFEGHAAQLPPAEQSHELPSPPAPAKPPYGDGGPAYSPARD
jgi:intracellular multiplication protein IcmE